MTRSPWPMSPSTESTRAAASPEYVARTRRMTIGGTQDSLVLPVFLFLVATAVPASTHAPSDLEGQTVTVRALTGPGQHPERRPADALEAPGPQWLPAEALV